MKYKYEFLYDSRQDYLWDEYQDYIAQKPMTAYERRLVRNWVKEGNSVYGCTQSRYYGESAYPMEFLEVYRSDRAIDKELQGKTPIERESYLKDLLGYQEETAEEKEFREAQGRGNTARVVMLISQDPPELQSVRTGNNPATAQAAWP